ncbi:hypothetical protein AVEN_233389-1 [Araneus ventricosus]|uniref:Mutator-like transposase domain-containing protein n=1 Tax=Araneus ventricosus TaxID=182803 RepID=A0A4Y2MIU3_ARAVE|nr:hypothetical protein AVEN_233389-1 [Araneus ventricosus]
MDLISKRYRKPKGHPCKRRSAQSANALKRWYKSVDKIDDSAVVETESKSDCIHQKNNVDGELIISSFAESQTVPSPACTIMDQNMWSSLLKEVSCNKCESKTLNVHVKGSYGFSHNIAIICETCQHQYNSTFSSEREVSSRKFDVNNKFVKAFLSIGKGHAALETFSMILGIPAMDSRTFSNFLSDLVIKNKDFKKQVLDLSRDAVRGKYIDCNSSLKNGEVIDVCVSYDGTWQKRGHTSLHGIGIVIDILTGLIIDFDVFIKYCQDCLNSEGMLGKNTPEFRIWHDSHKNDCQKNFNGSSNSMEMNAAAILWKRSVKEAKMRYMTLLSDDDGKTHQHLNEIQVYGKNVTIMKEECTNHVAKRVGTGLRNVVQDWKKKGVTLGGGGKKAGDFER